MKKIYTCLLMIMLVLTAKAQYTLDPNFDDMQVVQNNDSYVFYPTGNFVNRSDNLLSTVVHNGTNDTILIPISVGNITPNDAEELNTDFDTLTIDIAFEAFGLASASDYASSIHHTKEASYTIYSKFNTYSFTDITPTGGSSSIYETYKFLENSIDTLMLVITSGTYSFDKIRFDFSTNVVITNVGEELFGTSDQSAHFNNPVDQGELYITIPNSVSNATVQLVSMEGIVIDNKILYQGTNKWNVSHLKKGLYLLREVKSGSTTKVIIQ